MSGSFDPYHKWLGIPPKDQPPNHYRLLAIDRFESDPDVIASAADQRMAHVRSFQTGKHAARSQEILNEIAGARVCLLNSGKKAEYDRRLREQLGVGDRQAGSTAQPAEGPPKPPVLPPIPPVTPPLGETVPSRFEGVLPRRRSRRRKLALPGLAGVLVAAVLLGGVLTAILSDGGSQQTAGGGNGTEQGTESNPVPGPDSKPSPGGTPSLSPKEKAKPSPKEKTPPQPPDPLKPAPGPEKGPPESGDPKSAKVPVEDPDNKPPPKAPPEGPPQKVAVPDSAAQAAAKERLKDAFPNASAADLLTAARADDRTPEERFVLLGMAQDAAVDSSDVETALQVVDEIAQRYEIDALEMKVRTFERLSKSAETPSALAALAEKGLALVDLAISEKNLSAADRLATLSLSAAIRSGNSDLHKRATLQVLKVQELSKPGTDGSKAP